MEKMTVIKVFYNVDAEERWLNKFGARGYKLVSKTPFEYHFEKTGAKWHYIIEWLDSSPESEENAEYIKARVGNAIYCGKSNCYAYFASRSPLEHSSAGLKRARRRYYTVAAFWAAVAAVGLGLLIYNLIWVGKFNAMEYGNPARTAVCYIAPATALCAGISAFCFMTAAAFAKASRTYPVTEEYDK